eukprot:tig00001038_g6540.t1
MFEQINATFDRGMDERIQKPSAPSPPPSPASPPPRPGPGHGPGPGPEASLPPSVQALLGRPARCRCLARRRRRRRCRRGGGARVVGREGPRETIARLAREERFEAAFNAALSAGDVELVAWLCALVPSTASSPRRPALSQAVLVTLIQHLGFDLSRDTAAKLRWIQASCLALNPAVRPRPRPRPSGRAGWSAGRSGRSGGAGGGARVLGQLHAHLQARPAPSGPSPPSHAGPGGRQAVQRSYVAAPGDLSAASTLSSCRPAPPLLLLLSPSSPPPPPPAPPPIWS